jgi:hypothetical protein
MFAAMWIVILGLALISSLLFFPHVELGRQSAVAQNLLGTSTALFAILGVWIAVLDPTQALDQRPGEQPSERERLAQDLLRPWIAATGVFGLSIILNFGLEIFPLDVTNKLFLTASGFFVSLLFLSTLYVLIGTILPVIRLHYKYKEKRKRARYRKR